MLVRQPTGPALDEEFVATLDEDPTAVLTQPLHSRTAVFALESYDRVGVVLRPIRKSPFRSSCRGVRLSSCRARGRRSPGPGPNPRLHLSASGTQRTGDGATPGGKEGWESSWPRLFGDRILSPRRFSGERVAWRTARIAGRRTERGRGSVPGPRGASSSARRASPEGAEECWAITLTAP